MAHTKSSGQVTTRKTKATAHARSKVAGATIRKTGVAAKAEATSKRTRRVVYTKIGPRKVPTRKLKTRAAEGSSGPASYSALYYASSLEQIERIRGGLRARDANRLFEDLDLGRGQLLHALGLPRATIDRKARGAGTLSPAESERVIGLARLIGQVEEMVKGSRSPEAESFDVREWISRWLQEPLPALGGVRPIDILDTMEGQALVSRALAQIEGGAYA